MKKSLLIFLLTFGYYISAQSQIIKSYIKNDIAKNKQLDLICILNTTKGSPRELLRTYSNPVDKRIRQILKKQSAFNQQDSDRLIKETKNDTIARYWTNEDKNLFGFDEISDFKIGSEKSIEVYKKHQGYMILYTLSAPLFTDNGQYAIFLLIKNGVWPGSIIEQSTVIMKKENDSWIFVEKIFINSKSYGYKI